MNALLGNENTQDQQPRTKEAAHMSDDTERSVASAGYAWTANAGVVLCRIRCIMRTGQVVAATRPALTSPLLT